MRTQAKKIASASREPSRNTLFPSLRWENWPVWLIYAPVFFYYLGQALKRGSLFLFARTNPSIRFGGLVGEKKDEIYKLLPDHYLPFTKLFPKSTTCETLIACMKAHHLDFPLIFKPNIGERGWMVEQIRNVDDMQSYLSRIDEDFLLQEFVDLPLEVGIFYYRYPHAHRGKVCSMVLKKPLSIRGDGHSTVLELMLKDPEKVKYIPTVENHHPEKLSEIPPLSEKEDFVLHPIGNHCKGATFLDHRKYITEKLNLFFNQLASKIDGFYVGRFDIKCRSLPELEEGKDFKIVELNGAGAELCHIYSPGYSYLRALRDIIEQVNIYCDIAAQNVTSFPVLNKAERKEFTRLALRAMRRCP